MRNSRSSDNPIGAVFTPLRWAKWLVQEFGIAQKWLNGATICDPTAGEGVFVFALIDEAKALGARIDEALLSHIFLIERSNHFIETFKRRFKVRQGVEFPAANIVHADVVLDTLAIKADVLVGNPPWINFTDLEADYKEVLKPFFLQHGLIHNTQSLLLGASRVDLAALIISKTVKSLLNRNGEAIFFIPLSLFLNDSAHAGFRKMAVKGTLFAVRAIYDFGDESVFDSVSARFGVARFVRDAPNRYPVPYKVKKNGQWKEQYAAPLHGDGAPLSVLDSEESWIALKQFEPIAIRKDQSPRQGVNTCGANDVLVFKQYPSFLPDEYIYPLLTKEVFQHAGSEPKKYILLPYERHSAKPLSEHTLRRCPQLWDYLNEHRSELINRKGTLINSWIGKNAWWACLGVGPYCFTPFKVVWEALGKKHFNPIVVGSFSGKPWQANQALHCFIPSHNLGDAEGLLKKLRNPLVERYLLSTRMAGTCNWAQPGRIKRLLRIVEEQLSLELALG